MNYRTRPVVVNAIQWWKNGDHPDDGPGEGQVVRYWRRPDEGDRICQRCRNKMDAHGWIDVPGEGLTVCPGDWIVTAESGERQVYTPTAFNATYEEVLPVATSATVLHPEDRMVRDIRSEVERARAKFPSNQHMLAALTEEVGEFAQALIDHSREKKSAADVYVEAVQVATMAIRIALEGDASFPYKCHLPQGMKVKTPTPWIKVTDGLPPLTGKCDAHAVSENVWVWCPGMKNPEIGFYWPIEGAWCDAESMGRWHRQPTHWAPLLRPPEVD
jgi:hypothetical protein